MSLSAIRSILKTEVPAKEEISLFVVFGSSMSNGFSSDWNQVGADKDDYFDDGEDVDDIYRLDMDSDSNQKGTSATFRPKLLNSEENGGTRKFSNCWYMARDMVNNSLYSTKIAVFEASHNNTSIIDGEGISWHPDDSTGWLNIEMPKLKWFIRYLEGLGYEVKVKGVNFSNHAVETTGSTVQAEYTAAITAIISEIRTELADWVEGILPFVWDAVDGVAWTPQSTAYRAAVLAYSGDDYFDYFDLADHMVAGDGVHPRSITVRNFGKFLSSRFYTLANDVSIPTASSVSINGSLEQNEYITANYTYADSDGDSEGDTEIHVEYADDASGTNKVTMLYHVTGGSTQLVVTQVSKYIRVGVIPISSSGKVGKIEWTDWSGPVTS